MRNQIKRLMSRPKKVSERERVLSGIDFVLKSGGGSLNTRIVLFLKDKKTK